jgi:four helix bundle protein
MNADELELRTKQFSLRILRLVDRLPTSAAGRAIANQLVRSGTAVGANYRAARRSRSRKEFIARIGIVAEEADESEYWIGLIIGSEMMNVEQAGALHREADELRRIFATMRRSARVRQRKTSG